MKKLVKGSLFVAILLSSAAFAGRPAIDPATEIKVGSPNDITCESEAGDLKLTIFGFENPLHMTLTQIRDDGHEWESELSNPYYTNTGLGQIIAGFDPSIADATIIYNLIMPNVLVNLGSEDPVEFKTTLVRSFSGGYWFGGPQAGVGITNQLTSMNCIARFVYVN